MESLLKDLKRHVTCSICLDTFTEPKTIACLHTFCCECLKRHALTSQRNGKFRCPECQAEVAVPEANRFDKLPTSFHHNSLLSLLAVRQSGDGSEISCGICKKKSAEISYCFECAKFLCSDCVNAHELFRNAAFEGHKVTPVKHFQPQDYEALLKRQAYCSQQYHEREVVRFFCTDCETCVCQICLNTKHKTHEMEPLQKVADDEKANILSRAEFITQKIKSCNDAIHELVEKEVQLETNVASAKREVSQAADQMVAKIREREREDIAALDNTRVSRMEKLNSAKTQIDSFAKQLNQAVEFAKTLVQGGSSSDIMQSKKNLEERLEDLCKTPVPALSVSSLAKFVPTCDPENLSLGFMTTSKIDVNRSTVEVLTQDFQAGVQAEFIVHPRIHEKEGEDGVKCRFHVNVRMEPADKVANLIVCDQEDRNFHAKFVPKVPGSFSITVKINGEELPTSPFTVQVKERLIQVVGELDLKEEIPQCLSGIAVNGRGQIAVADDERHCILIFDKEGKCVQKLGYGKHAGQLDGPADVTFINDDEILVAEELNHRIQQFNVRTGNFVKSFGKEGIREGDLKNPTSVCFDDEGHIVVADFNNRRVQVLSKDGEPVFVFGDCGPGKLYNPIACICHKKNFIVSDWNKFNYCLKVFDSSGKFLYKIGEPGNGDRQLRCPWGLCIQQCDSHPNLLVCNTNNGRIDQFTVEGCFTGKTVATLKNPVAITTTPNGQILVSDVRTHKIYILK